MRLQRYKKIRTYARKRALFFEILTTYHLVFKTHVRARVNFYFSLLGCEVARLYGSLYGYYFFFLKYATNGVKKRIIHVIF